MILFLDEFHEKLKFKENYENMQKLIYNKKLKNEELEKKLFLEYDKNNIIGYHWMFLIINFMKIILNKNGYRRHERINAFNIIKWKILFKNKKIFNKRHNCYYQKILKI